MTLHERIDGRLRACAFQGPPNDVDVERISDSCGYSVPLMTYEGDRDLLIRAHERRTEADLAQYRRVKNAVSIDGRPVFAEPEHTP